MGGMGPKMSIPPRNALIAIIGATGTGKSKLAVDLALRFNGEIINGDAMQMYRGLPIITNKITAEETKGVPHHLLGCVSPLEKPWNVTTFTKECLDAMKGIHERGKIPILVGGTHYYIESVLLNESLVNGAEYGEQKCQARESDAERWPVLSAPAEEMYAKLKDVDPVMASRWHPNDTRKVRRSLEIWLQTGRPASEVYEEQKRANQLGDRLASSKGQYGDSRLRFPTQIFWIGASKDVLDTRLDKRVDQMVDGGLIREVDELVSVASEEAVKGNVIDQTSGIWVSIGFKEVQPYVIARRAGSVSMEEQQNLKASGIELTKIATRQYVRRQERWIKYKFMDTMEEAGETSRVFPIDSTNLESWSEDVQEVSERLCAAFLDGKPLPYPASISEMARETLESIGDEREKRVRKARECQVCNKILMTESEWEAHLKSTKHKNTVRYRTTEAPKFKQAT